MNPIEQIRKEMYDFYKNEYTYSVTMVRNCLRAAKSCQQNAWWLNDANYWYQRALQFKRWMRNVS